MQNNGRLQIARGVRIMAVRDGAVILSPNDRFRIRERSEYSFVSDFIPKLYQSETLSGTPRELLPDWFPVVCRDLQQVGILSCLQDEELTVYRDDKTPRIGIVRKTLLTDCVAQRLNALGLTVEDSPCNSEFTIADFTGLDGPTSLELARRIYESGTSSISVWNRGTETFYGPLAIPSRTACWNCCQLRFADSVTGGNVIVREAYHATSKILADNILLAVRFPEIAAYGCVVVDDGISSSLHSVVPMPWCEVCNFGSVATATYECSASEVSQIPAEMRVLADARAGVIRRLVVFDNTNGAEAPGLPCCCSAVIASFQYRGEQQPTFTGEGKGATADDAARSAIGEGVERYSASIWHPSRLTRKAFNGVRSRAFDPRWLVLYDDMQYKRKDFPFSRFEPDQEMLWTTGKWLDTNEQVLLPAIAAYMNFPGTDSERFCQTTSNGLAAGSTLEDATLRALYELIERDAFMLFWLARRPGVPVFTDTCDDLTTEALRGVKRLGALT